MPKPRVVVYPFLVALYFVLALAAQNAHEVVWLRYLEMPVAISLLVAAIAWVLSRLLTSDVHKRALITLIGVVWFAGYGYFERLVAVNPWLYVVSHHAYAAPIFLLFLGSIGYLTARRYPRPLGDLSRYLNVTAILLLAFPLWTLVRSRGITGRQPATSSAAVSTRDVPPGDHAENGRPRPDIYLIVLDAYTASGSLARNYGYSNQAFETKLQQRGFMVPRTPRSNYVHTHLALASLLNWQLLDDRPARLTASDGALELDRAAIEDNRTWRFLRDRGYRFIFFPSADQVTAQNRYADLEMPNPAQVTSGFEVEWRRTTLAQPILYWWCRTFRCRGDAPYQPPPVELIEWQFQHLAQLPDSVGPVFAFAHFVLPHWPFMFNSDCTQGEAYWPTSESEADQPRMKRAYVQQVECVNRKVLNLVDALLARSKSPPIIILQADHGNGRFGRVFPGLDAATPDRVRERTEPFAAYYLPGDPDGVVYDSITPVNVLPRIFNHFFGTDIPLQDDATYWSTWDQPFSFTRVR